MPKESKVFQFIILSIAVLFIGGAGILFSGKLKRPLAPQTSPAIHSGPSLLWPIQCKVGADCRVTNFPDPKKTGKTALCASNFISGHEGTDIAITPRKMDEGVPVVAAASGTVLWVFDGKYDRCPSSHEDCQDPQVKMEPLQQKGFRVCTPLGLFCDSGEEHSGMCFWCFDGGNVIVIRHDGIPGVFATRYDHFKQGSINVIPGQKVSKGEFLGLVGSAGHSTGPHLHFEVWGKGFYDPVDPWKGECSEDAHSSLWESQPVVNPDFKLEE
jgi:murein DD-endopeptidase MepM/ murein hydrolase activator NlpD